MSLNLTVYRKQESTANEVMQPAGNWKPKCSGARCGVPCSAINRSDKFEKAHVRV